MSASAAELPSVNDRWLTFAQQVLPKEASAIQRKEMKRAFFAGFTACLVGGVEMVAFPDEDGAARLMRYHEECKGFAVAVEMGAA